MESRGQKTFKRVISENKKPNLNNSNTKTMKILQNNKTKSK
jgi:hypothetical protein